MRTLLADPLPPTMRSENKIRKPRLGFLDVGQIGRFSLEAIEKSGRAEITAIADPSSEVREQIARMQPQAAVFDSLEALLTQNLDGIVIATLSPLNADHAVVALEHGLAVFCQKPPCRSVAETKRVIDAARKADRLLGVSLPYRFISGAQRIHELCRSGELGDIHAVKLTLHNAFQPDKWSLDDRPSSSGVIDPGVHLIDLALWTLNFPRVTSVKSRGFAQDELLRAPVDTVQDRGVARLDLETGTTVQLSCSWERPAGYDAVISVSFHGTKGGATFRNVNSSMNDFVAECFYDNRRESLGSEPAPWSARAAIDWTTRLGESGRYSPNIEELHAVADSVDQIYFNSNLERERV